MALAKTKLNSLSPALRENQRYVAYEIVSEKPLYSSIDRTLCAKITALLGIFEGPKAGVMSMKYYPAAQQGVLRVERKFLDKLRACFVVIKELNNEPVAVRTLGVSGMIKKAEARLKMKESPKQDSHPAPSGARSQPPHSRSQAAQSQSRSQN